MKANTLAAACALCAQSFAPGETWPCPACGRRACNNCHIAHQCGPVEGEAERRTVSGDKWSRARDAERAARAAAAGDPWYRVGACAELCGCEIQGRGTTVDGFGKVMPAEVRVVHCATHAANLRGTLLTNHPTPPESGERKSV